MADYLDESVTLHFTRREFVFSQTAVRFGIDNTPPPKAWDAIASLAVNVLEPLRAVAGPIRITSGYRSPELNARIGGAANSQHTAGEAVDIIPVRGTLRGMFEHLQAYGSFDQLIWEFGEWVHVSWALDREQRLQVLRAVRGPSGTVYGPYWE